LGRCPASHLPPFSQIRARAPKPPTGTGHPFQPHKAAPPATAQARPLPAHPTLSSDAKQPFPNARTRRDSAPPPGPHRPESRAPAPKPRAMPSQHRPPARQNPGSPTGATKCPPAQGRGPDRRPQQPPIPPFASSTKPDRATMPSAPPDRRDKTQTFPAAGKVQDTRPQPQFRKSQNRSHPSSASKLAPPQNCAILARLQHRPTPQTRNRAHKNSGGGRALPRTVDSPGDTNPRGKHD